MISPSSSSQTPMTNGVPRKLPLALAIGLHVAAFLLILFPPNFLLMRRTVPDVQTINLFDAGDLNLPAASGPKMPVGSVTRKGPPAEPKKEPAPPKPEAKQEEPAKPPEPEKSEPPKPELPEPPKPEPIPEPPKPEPPKPEPPKPKPPEPKPEPPPTIEPKPLEKVISLSPKTVKKKAEPEKPAPEPPKKAETKPEPKQPDKPKPEKPVAKTDDRIMKSLERIQARVKERETNQAIKDKLSRLRDSLHDIATAEPSAGEKEGTPMPGSGGTDKGGTAATGSGGGSSMLDEALKKYYIAISRKVHSNWALPDTQNWDSNLEAIAVIVIKRDGTVVETFFEKNSGNAYFDQYVEKTLKAAQPLPPFPSDLKEDELEIGLRFKPSGLF